MPASVKVRRSNDAVFFGVQSPRQRFSSTLELSGRRRRAALAWWHKMSEANATRPKTPAVAGPLERRVRFRIRKRERVHFVPSQRDATR